MLRPSQQAALTNFYLAARAANHVWPAMAACEAALESGWGMSQLARKANNFFGQKQSTVPVYTTLAMTTRECVAGRWQDCNALWVVFPSAQACFAARMDLLRRLPRYAPALAAKTPEAYIRAISPQWATDPGRAGKCLSIYELHGECFA